MKRDETISDTLIVETHEEGASQSKNYDPPKLTNSLWSWKPISRKGYLRSYLLQTLGLCFGVALFNADGSVAHFLGFVCAVGMFIVFNIAVARRCAAKGHSHWLFPIIYVPIFGWHSRGREFDPPWLHQITKGRQ